MFYCVIIYLLLEYLFVSLVQQYIANNSYNTLRASCHGNMSSFQGPDTSIQLNSDPSTVNTHTYTQKNLPFFPQELFFYTNLFKLKCNTLGFSHQFQISTHFSVMCNPPSCNFPRRCIMTLSPHLTGKHSYSTQNGSLQAWRPLPQ